MTIERDRDREERRNERQVISIIQDSHQGSRLGWLNADVASVEQRARIIPLNRTHHAFSDGNFKAAKAFRSERGESIIAELLDALDSHSLITRNSHYPITIVHSSRTLLDPIHLPPLAQGADGQSKSKKSHLDINPDMD